MGWIGNAVHLDKGCYRGQETVARVHTLGRPPRRLTLLHLDGSENRLPQRGQRAAAGRKAVGVVGTSARHHELGPIALALVKRNVPVEASWTPTACPPRRRSWWIPRSGCTSGLCCVGELGGATRLAAAGLAAAPA